MNKENADDVVKTICDIISEAEIRRREYSKVDTEKLEIIYDDQMFYYDTLTTQLDFYTKLDKKYYQDKDYETKVIRYMASIQKQSPRIGVRFKMLLEVVDRDFEDTVVVGFDLDKNIRYIKRLNNLIVKYYLNALIMECVEPNRQSSFYDSCWFFLLKKYNFLDEDVQDKHFIFLKQHDSKLRNDINKFIKAQGIDCDLQLHKYLIVFTDTIDYHLFALHFKDKILFNANVSDFREKIIENIILKDVEKSLTEEILLRYDNVDLIDKV